MMVHKSFQALIGTIGALATLGLSTVANAQSSPSPYTSATRYDDLGRVVGTIAPDPDGSGSLKYAATRTTYDARGNVIRQETGELSAWKSETQDPHSWSGFTVQTIVETTYDALSRKLTDKVSGKSGSTVTAISLTQYSYDNVGRLECTAQRMNPAAYNSLPSSACTLGPQGADGPDRITKTVYDAAGQVLQVRRAVGTNVEIADVTYTYTDNGQIENVVDANGNRAELRYDGHDRQIRWVFPSKTRPSNFNDATPASAISSAGAINNSDYEAYGYDDNGNRLSLRKRDGLTILYEYDDLNRMTRKVVPSRSGLSTGHTRNVLYEYDLRGLQTKALFNALGSTGRGVRYTYDGFGRLTSEAQNSDGTTRTVSSQYDANGNRTQITHPDGNYWQYEYDGLNRLDLIRQHTWRVGELDYNNRGLMSELRWWVGGSATWNRRNYDYDNAGRLDQIGFDLTQASKDVTWDYTRNPASQIKSETQSNDTYSWDGHVNLDRSYTTNGLNQYTNAGGAAFCYDANGNLTADGASVYLYDVENRLVEKRVQTNTNCSSLSYSGTRQATLYYDPTGRLYHLTDAAGSGTSFVYDGNALIMEYASASTILRRYVHGSNIDADDPLIVYEGSGVDGTSRRFLHADPRGSIVAVTSSAGNSIRTNTYDEFGIPDTASGNDIATKGRFRYTGQAWIPELGMYYYKARIYSPTLGRFLQTDPIGYEDQYNLYAYVGNDPINGIDPTGESCDAVKDSDGYTCKVDHPRGLEGEDLDKVNQAYTNAVNNLMADPDREVTLTATDADGNTVSEVTTAGAIGEALIDADVAFRSLAPGLQDMSATQNGLVDVYGFALSSDKDVLSESFIHEGAHMTNANSRLVERYENRGGRIGSFLRLVGWNADTSFQEAHQASFNAAAKQLFRRTTP